MERSCDAWARMRDQARELSAVELRRHATIPAGSDHECTECFTCACAAVIEENRKRAAWLSSR